VKDVIGSILPLAIAVTISPVPIIAEILLLFTKKPVANAASYLAGFIVGVAGVLAILVAIAGTINLSAGSGPSKGASILQLALGALLLVAALRQFRGRPKPGQEASMPKWMNGIAGFAPGKSLIVAVPDLRRGADRQRHRRNLKTSTGKPSPTSLALEGGVMDLATKPSVLFVCCRRHWKHEPDP
jgi:hypothetical protein